MNPVNSNTGNLHRGPLGRLQRRLGEAMDDLWASYVDRREAWTDDGEAWLPLGGLGAAGGAVTALGPIDEAGHRAIREECRRLAVENEFAINALENRVNYIVGTGHSYHAVVKKGCGRGGSSLSEMETRSVVSGQLSVGREEGATSSATDHGQRTTDNLASAVQSVIDEFLRENRWHARQQEIVRRLDRDGEAFLRLFVDERGATRVRFVEPDQVATPVELASNPAASFGILTDADDVETVRTYFIDGRPVEAAQVQHRKANVDANVRRGLSLFYPVLKNLRRAEKLLRNMSVVAEIQSAIALIRRHRSAGRDGVERFVADSADASGTRPGGRPWHVRQYGPGTILDAPAGLEYDFPAAGIDAANFVTVLGAELRAIASRLVMPEFMLTSDASNANYASTMVAEGPAIKMFGRLQAAQIEADREVLTRVLQNAIAAVRLPREALTEIELQIVPPRLAIRNPLEEARVAEIAFRHGVLSKQTWCQQMGLDFEQERRNREGETTK